MCVSTSLTNAASRAIGVFFVGALAWPPDERAVNLTSPLPFFKNADHGEVALNTADRLGDYAAALVTDEEQLNAAALKLFTIFGAPSPAHSSVQDEARYTSHLGV